MCKEKVACSCSSLERMKDGDYFPDILNTSMPAQCSYIVRLQLRFYKGMPWNPFAQMLMFQSKLKKVLQQFTEACNILSHPITHHPFLRVSSQLVPHFVVVSFPPLNEPTDFSYQFISVAQSCLTLWDAMNCSTPGLPVHRQLPEFTQTHIHRVSDASSHLILGRPLLLLPPIPPSIRDFSNESAL